MGLKQKWAANAAVLKEPVAPAPPRPHANPRSVEIATTTELVGIREELAAARERQVQLIDPHRVRPSRMMNRHEATFQTQAYRDLVASVKAAGGNEQPASVRRVKGDPQHDFEIIAGLRRHRAAMETGTQLKVMIEDVDDSRAYDIMTRENSQHADLSPWEWGRHYLEGLAIKKCTQKELAEQVGMSAAHINQALLVGQLPDALVAAFASPLEIQLAWGRTLTQALERQRERVLGAAASVATTVPRPEARAIYRQLLAAAAARGRPKATAAVAKPRSFAIGKVKGTLAVNRGTTTLQVRAPLDAQQLEQLEAFVKRLLAP